MASAKHIAAKAALEFYADHGVDIAVDEEVVDRTKIQSASSLLQQNPSTVAQQPSHPSAGAAMQAAPAEIFLGKSEARAGSLKLAQEAKTLDELKDAIAAFDGIAIKKTATNLVFCDGNEKAPIMLIGEAPGADEDRHGTSFAGITGQLLDKIFACIGLDRKAEDPMQSIYISNILNWRPPGNRTPSQSEIEVSLPFIERHIQLVQPKLIVLCGGATAKALLGSGDSISRLRKKWHDYMPQTPEFRGEAKPIPAIVTYRPADLLRTPAQKKSVWADMLSVQEKMNELGLKA